MKLAPDDFYEPISPLRTNLVLVSKSLLVLCFILGFVRNVLGFGAIENKTVQGLIVLFMVSIPFCILVDDLIFKLIKSKGHKVIKVLIIMVQIFLCVQLLRVMID